MATAFPSPWSAAGRNVVVQLRGDGSSPHTLENSRAGRRIRRARSACRQPISPSVWRTTRSEQRRICTISSHLPALPIKVGDDVIGAVGVSGAPGGDKDEVCAKAGIDKVADLLK